MTSLAFVPRPTTETPFDAVSEQIVHCVADEQVEVAAFAYCNVEGGVLGLRLIRSQRSDMLDLAVRRLAIDALTFDAAVLVMAHNHPSGELQPSRADVLTTRRIGDAMSALDVRLYDHLIVARGARRWSFRAAGLL